jgi:hypothetical protein
MQGVIDFFILIRAKEADLVTRPGVCFRSQDPILEDADW